MQGKRKSKMGFQSNHFKKIGNINVRKLSTEVLNNSSVFLKNFMADDNVNLPFFPDLKNPKGRTFEKYSGNQNIGIKNYLHLFLLTLFIALLISDNFNPALRACFRASLSKSSN